VTLLDRLERHLGQFAITGLIRYVVMLNALVYLMVRLNPENISILIFDRDLILHGQIWRVFSWIFIPTTFSLLWILPFLWFTWWMGDCLEETWGAFRLNVYYFLGVAGCVVAAFIFNVGGGDFNIVLNLTLLFATATLAPDLEILLFYILPMKLKWIALISLIFPSYGPLSGPLYNVVFGDPALKTATILCLTNYLVFFGPSLLRQAQHNRETQARRARFEAAKTPDEETLHRCAVCGLTEATAPDMDFRVAADGREYCTTHLPGK